MLRTTTIKNGDLRGTSAADPRITSYRGIPYATPPVGKLRWCRPEPCGDWDGVKDCLEFAPIAMQSIPGLDKENIYTGEWNVDPEISMSEDCLYLNVWTPAKTKAENLPVYVWFHGGALQWGNTAEMEFDGERIARRGIVVVTVAYRLNVFGFFAHPSFLEKDGPESLNLGNLDQQFALRWIRENITAFGGNPEQITIGGQSAGGGSVITQLNSVENRNCIKGAIIESGIFHDPHQKLFELTRGEALEQGSEFLKYLGVSTIDEARKLSAEYIRDKNDEFNKFWGTVVDGNYQTGTYRENIENKKFLDVPLFIGWTDNEFLVEEIKESKVSSIEIGSRRLLECRERAGYATPAYLYEFGADIPGKDRPGAFHSSDLWFFFETLAKCTRPFMGGHYDLARQMCNYWCNFIKTGDPNGVDADGSRQESWNAYVKKQPHVMWFFDKPEQRVMPAKEEVQQYIDSL